MHDRPTTHPTPHLPMPAALPVPAEQTPDRVGHPGAISLDEVAALVERASGADTTAIEALEAVAANLRRAAAARTQLAVHVPPVMLRQVLLARSIYPTTQPTGDAEQGDRNGLPS